MKRLISALLLAFFCTGCGTTVHTLLETDNGKNIRCSSGDIVEIRLPGNPSTGFTWHPAGLPSDTVLVLKQDTFETAAPRGNKFVGVPGTFIFKYEVTGKGSEGIRLVYSRKWENVAPSSFYEVLINAD